MLDALVALFCGSNISADVRLVGGWLFRQLLPHGEEEFTAFHLKRLKVHGVHYYSFVTVCFGVRLCVCVIIYCD